MQHLSTKTNGVVSTLRYSTASSAFYWGYIIAVLPMALMLQRLPLARTLSLLIFLWGVTVILTVVVSSYQGLIVQRVFLGVLESSVSPGFVMITSQWYTASEQATRLGIWYSATGIFSVFSGVVNYGLGKAGGPLHPWKYMYLFAGAWTIVWSAVVFFVIPDSPETSHRWFNDEERVILEARSRRSMVGARGNTAVNWSHVKEAATDVKVYLYLLMGASIYICNGGVTAFGARIVSSFGYSSLTTIVIVIPGGVFTMASWVHRGVPLFGYYLLPCFGAPYVLLLSLSAANVSGSTKKAITAGAIFIGYNVGNIIAPYLVFTPEKAIKYRSTWIAIITCMVITSIISLLLRMIYTRENTRRDALERSGSSEAVNVQEKQQELDQTDKQNMAFRYSL
ncbi:hypothetical protein RQP46_004615 [Phenoliferia psychrophenolica]